MFRTYCIRVYLGSLIFYFGLTYVFPSFSRVIIDLIAKKQITLTFIFAPFVALASIYAIARGRGEETVFRMQTAEKIIGALKSTTVRNMFRGSLRIIIGCVVSTLFLIYTREKFGLDDWTTKICASALVFTLFTLVVFLAIILHHLLKDVEEKKKRS